MRRDGLLVLGALVVAVGCSPASNKSNDGGATGGSAGSSTGGSGGSAGSGSAGTSGAGGADGGGAAGSGGSAGTGGAAGSGGTSGAAGSAGAAGAGGGPGLDWHAISAPTGQDDASMLGVYCSGASKCVLATHSNTGDPGAVFAMSDTTVGAKLLDGTYQGALSNVSGILGDLDFQGFTPTSAGLVARVSDASVYAVAASGSDITQASSWTFKSMGRSGGSRVGGDFADIQTSSNKWVLVASGIIYSGSTAPGDTSAWTGLWSPTRVPPFPGDFTTQYNADKTLCDADVTAGGIPFPSDPIYISQDLGLMVSVAGGLNQNENGDSQVGVCISTDQGQHFYYVPFAGTPANASSPGPVGVTCTDNDHCYALTARSSIPARATSTTRRTPRRGRAPRGRPRPCRQAGRAPRRSRCRRCSSHRTRRTVGRSATRTTCRC